eukprot:Awhi_evm1s11455
MVQCGGFGDSNPADDKIKSLCEKHRDEALEQCQQSGWNGMFVEFTPVEYKTQVVAGTNYLVKVKTSDSHHVHLKIYEPLPHTNEPTSLTSTTPGLTAESPL